MKPPNLKHALATTDTTQEGKTGYFAILYMSSIYLRKLQNHPVMSFCQSPYQTFTLSVFLSVPEKYIL